MKKILIASGVAVLALVTIASAAAFNANLTVGSTGTDVTALQSTLIAAGYSIPAGATGYFGSQTKAAVKLYQAAHGVPNTGFVGPLTRAALNGGTVATPVTSGCPVGYDCFLKGTTGTIVTGTITTVGAEGVITTKLASTPIADANIRTSSNVPVWGVEVKAQGSDMIVDRVLLQMSVGVGGTGEAGANSASNPATFVRTIYAYDGSTLLKSWNVSAADFNKDSSDRYYIIASGLRFVVPKDTSKVLTFKVDVVGVSSDQSSRYLTVQGYAGNTQNIRAIDGAGLSQYSDMSGTANSRQQIFATSGSSTITATANASLSPKATNNKVDSTDGVKGLTMQVLDVKSTTGDSTIKKICLAVNATSTAGLPSTLYLYDGSTMIGSVSAATTEAGQSCFTDLTYSVAKDQTKQLTVKADFASTVHGQAASTSLAATGIQYYKPDSTVASSSNSKITGNNQYLFSTGPQFALVSASSVASAGVKDVSSSSVSGTIVLRATAFGGAMVKPVAADFTVVFASSTQTTYSAANSVTGGQKVVTVDPADATVGDGGTYTITVTDTVYSNDSELASSQPLFMAISNASTTVGSFAITTQTWGLDTFYTPAQQLTRGTF